METLKVEIAETKTKLTTAEVRLEKSIDEGNPADIRADLRALVNSASQRMTVLQTKETELLKIEAAHSNPLLKSGAGGFGPPLKRPRALSSSSRGSNGTELNQESFRERILARDTNGCVLTGREDLDCDACHIVPWTYFQQNDLVGRKIFDLIFSYSCDNPEHRVMDVRNGILMWSRLNAPFDKFDFTIFKRGDSYIVESLQEHEFPSATSTGEKKLQILVSDLNGKTLSFEEFKRNEWPGEQFLRFHNECFKHQREESKLKAQAEALEMEEDDSEQTVGEIAETTLLVKNEMTDFKLIRT